MVTTGGQLVAKALVAQGVRRVFCVAGESYLPVLDALLEYPEIEVITCRQEGGAAFMAEAYANLTGEPGVVMVTRGPGACNGSIGIHTGKQSSTPMVMLVGLVATADRGKEAFQEFDLEQMFGSHSKFAKVIDGAERIPDIMAHGFHQARSGRAGPAVIGLPEDILFGTIEKEIDGPKIEYAKATHSGPTLGALTSMLNTAQRPLVLVGGFGWNDEACRALEKFSSANNLPVAAAFRRQDLFNHNHGNYIGELGTGPNPALVERVKQADVILVMGARLDEITTQGYSLFSPDQKIIHVYPSEEVFGKSYVPALGIEADPASLATVMAETVRFDARKWEAWRDAGRKEYIGWSDIKEEARDWNGADMTEIFRQLRDVLPSDAIVTTDAGNFSGWCQRYLRYGRPGRLLAPISGAMGYGVPSAVSASIEHRDRIVLGVAGDGGFMMNMNELATAMQYNAKPIIMVCNNSMYGTIRMHQQKHYPGRVSATTLTNPDFVKLAQSFGAHAVRVSQASQFKEAWQQSVSAGKLALIEIQMDPAQIRTGSVPAVTPR